MMINPFANKKVRNIAIGGVALLALVGVAYAAVPKKKTRTTKALKK